MLRLLTTLLFLFQITLLSAAYNVADYTYPVLGAAHLYTGNFGELRTNHFHSGVDIKTDEVIGKRVVAACDGYVSRISLSPYGYGLAIYLAHPNGTTTVYGHLSKLRDDIEEYLQNERYRTKQHSLNLYPEASKYRVKKGDLIAFSGNSGSSGGPHVHFEVRDSAQSPLNPVTLGIITPADSIAPLIFNVYYAESQTIDGVCYTKGVSKYPVTKGADGDYTLRDRDVMWVGREGYFIFEVSDRRDGVSNTFGLYRISGSIDGKSFYEYQQDGFSFNDTRYCNGISYYPYQGSNRSEFFLMKRLEGVPQRMIKSTDKNGVVTTKVGDSKSVVLSATDDMGNVSTLKFTIRGKDEADCYQATEALPEMIIRPAKSYYYNDGNLAVTMPPGVVYEPTIFSFDVKDIAAELPSGVKSYSREYSVMDNKTPLHSSISVSIKADSIPATKQAHVCMVNTSTSGRTSAVEAKYSDGKVTFSTRTASRYYVAVDDVAPVVTLSFEEGATLSGAKGFTIKVSDNFSGVSSYSAKIDGEWIALDLSGSTLTHNFREEGDGEIHELVVTVTDMCKNSTTLKRRFKR